LFQFLVEQDKGLEELCKVITRQKEIGLAISNEVSDQNGEYIKNFILTLYRVQYEYNFFFLSCYNIEIIDDLADHMDRTDESLINKTQQVRNIHFKDRTCGYWVVILILFVAIVIVSLV